jgi:tryptophan synthase alpha chain
MSRISSVFNKPGHKALIAYVTIGYPSIEATLKAVPLLAESGCDIIELGVPFSDPLADGATIQNASHHALENGVTVDKCLEIAGQLRQKVDIPLLFMTYYNPVYHYGLKAFCDECSRCGIDGLIVPDLPPEEGIELEKLLAERNGDLVYLLAPTSTEERIRVVTQHSSGFIYLVSLTGVTGARQQLDTNLDAFVKRVRKETNKPLCVGFGISTPEQAQKAVQTADGAIIGSRIIQLMETDPTLGNVRDFVKQVRAALDAPL